MDQIEESFAQLIAYINLKNNKDLFDINKFCEDFFCGLLNIIYKLKLKNLNRIKKKNYPAVDLGDYNSKVSYQITSMNTSSKIKETLEKVEKYKLYEEFNKINILILGEKGNYTSKDLTDPQYAFDFSIDTNVIDIFDLSEYIEDNKSLDDLEEICNYINENKSKYLSNSKNTKKIKKKDRLKLSEEVIENLLNKCELNLEYVVNKHDIEKLLDKISKCSKLEKSIMVDILNEYNSGNDINLSDIYNEYEDLEFIDYILSIKNLTDKKFIYDKKYYAYDHNINYVDDEIMEFNIRVNDGIWYLDKYGEILIMLKDLIGNEKFDNKIFYL
ncbi:SMEK domain-containing protein [Clostridium beijerinckii]|uniref:SMEK domain-containing protein n=2 Tax=Clostridium beijerinckii TaxID=1520 RepID=A0AAW3W617_CLOBE|nr:SMEK domain-containing protein [Clostridium beijerinckii]MBC2474341.1 SMEK domain-containing protein [Clostridium beijerinckii]NOV59025.1 hypothetical protein [Clostridium beijerinckii]NOV71587.1 hypothetical protein [Clostridium beijerinckii]NOW32380.1 hypothetical protein [Clostridium beijerinckii]NOW84904.1 hypothetical protein [Clostridium beijerinckii]